MFSTSNNNGFTVKAYQGDAKTLLAFDLPQAQTKGLAGFTIAYTPPGSQPFFIYNQLTLQGGPGKAQVATEPAQSSANAPIQKFRWTHVPGNFHQGDQVTYGNYVYQVTPRYFDPAGGLQLIDPGLSVKVTIPVQPFVKGNVALGFTRGFVQSQAFVHHFGVNALFKPKGHGLLYDTSASAGTNSSGQSFSFAQEYAWCGSTARTMIFDVLNEVLNDSSLALDMLAYDLDEPDVLNILLKLAAQGRISLILDNASLHTDAKRDKPEDEFEDQFNKVKTGNAYCLRGKFGRFQHNKILIVKKAGKAVKVLSGSTNFSVTGMYVNSNHVILFNDPGVATTYSNMFAEAWNDRTSETAFVQSASGTQSMTLKLPGISAASVTFAPHAAAFAQSNLQKIADRVNQETSSVLFAVMDTGPTSSGPLIPALVALHSKQTVYNAGISDSTNNISLYKPNDPAGIAVTGKPSQVLLPPPFDKEASIGLGHQVHDKFIVCGFNTASAVVWLGSSNLALGGEEQNGDNLIEIHDTDVATAFAIEALDLVDHFDFRDLHSKQGGEDTTNPATMSLAATDAWATSYYDPNDYHTRERTLFK
ncbi:phospholipase D-like domain-containing protein [Dinghuibacter silviterrae]|uniref:phospholipase D n=1 Tax=Dinghuibacter silviterrae TaxID=1539049 RepID=A0A4R8DTG9_9BACT|nr:phospholipase D-like domain-containing protein [Dinghuibacter silviterrae]TDX01584.1 phosphatidylserine/phosphatidylglycerophosphate/cardiolipin synthase-like enzyme [Dinghuibacter silviterrae]